MVETFKKIRNNNLSNNKPLWYLFINGNEIPNSFVFINFFENKVNAFLKVIREFIQL